MIIKIDFRETSLIEQVNRLVESYSGITIVTENLLIGDAAICRDDGSEVLIIERKSLSDLASSIRDGRYSEQSHRLHNCIVPNHYIYYLIEGNIRTYKPSRHGSRPITWKELSSAMTSLSFTKGFSVHRSIDVTESAMWILQSADKVSRTKDCGYYYQDETKQKTAEEYVDCTKRAKKGNVNEDNIGAIMLAQIPGVSSATSTAVMHEFDSIESLITALRKDPASLANIQLKSKTGKSRRINKTCQTNIYNYLLSNTTSEISVEC